MAHGGDRDATRLPTWTLLALALAVALLATVGIKQLDDQEDADLRAHTLLVDIEAAAYRLSALEWRAIAEGRLDPEVAAAAKATEVEIEDRLHELLGFDADNHGANSLHDATHAYRAAVVEEFRLLAAGDIAGARAVDEARVDPGFTALIDLLQTEEALHRERAEGAEQLFFAGFVGTLALAVVAIGVLIWRFEREQSAAARLEGEHRALVRSEARFRSLITNATDIITILDADGIILYESPPIERILGYDRDELVGSNAFDLVHPEDRATTWAAFAGALSDPALVPTVALRFQHKEGSWRWLESTGTNLLADRDVEGFVVNSRDITERKRRDEQLRAALEAAQAGNRAQRQFLAMMSHELRTPMQAVLGYADLLLAGGDDSLTPEQVEDVQTIRRGAERMMALVSQMLDLSRLEAGRMELSSGPVDLGKIIAQVRQDLAPHAETKGLELHIDLPLDLPPVLGDPGGVHQILLNLAGNAVKFTEEGTVHITGRVTEAGVAVAVSDTGIGIAAAALPQIFEEFRQVDGGMTRRHDGAGLGLAIAKVLAEQMGGRICVESRPDVGSTFTLHLPASDIERTPQESEHPAVFGRSP
jgi:PAS domain S-box-containing protein